MKIPAPGRIVQGIHMRVEGRGSPVVVLEAGIAASSVSWSLVQSRIAEFTTVISYDRAGFGWSEATPTGPTALDAAHSLSCLLDASGQMGSFVLVGHSFGGLIARLFAQHYPNRTAGLVLLDPVVREEWREMSAAKERMLGRGVMLSRRGAWLARAGVVGFALKMLTGGSRRIPKMMAKLSAGKGSGVADRLVGEVRKMPKEHWPAIAQHWSQARSFAAMADNLENLPASVRQLDEAQTMGDLPVTILTAARPIPEHARDVALSTRSCQVILPRSGHWVQLDAPDAVVDAVRRMVELVRA